MNKALRLEALSGQTGQRRDEVAKALDALTDTIGATLAKGEKLLLVGFGTFETQRCAARTGRNPQTGEAIDIPEAVVPKFSPGKRLKDRIAEANKPKEAPKAKKANVEARLKALVEEGNRQRQECSRQRHEETLAPTLLRMEQSAREAVHARLPLTDVFQEAVSIRAYFKAEQRDFGPGQEGDDWAEAEREVLDADPFAGMDGIPQTAES